MTEDVRWIQRYSNFNKALLQLKRFVATENLNDLEKQGLIKAFEYTYELAWKTLNDLLKHIGYSDIAGPNPTIQQSFKDGYIFNGKAWMQMHKSRNLTSHTYNEDTANEIVELIQNTYFDLLNTLNLRLQEEIKREEQNGFDE